MSIAIPIETSVERHERLFFMGMALAIATTVLIAFSLFYLAGISSFGAPWWVHIHAVTFVLWIAFYISQNTLVLRNDIALHRKLGRMGALYAIWMVVVGLVLTPLTLAVGRSPPFFTPPYFLALDWMNIIVFALLMYAAIHNRTRTDWHRRLMLCATICVIAPAWGRLILLSGTQMTTFNIVGMLLLCVAVAMVADWQIRRHVHPAYLWGTGALAGMGLCTELLAAFPPFIALADRIVG